MYGDARLFQLSEPVEYRGGKKTDHVVISAVEVPFSGPETYIFPADNTGAILSWCELGGSYRGGLSHEKAVYAAGWKLAGGYDPEEEDFNYMPKDDATLSE
jgi:hypothetical protein